MTVNLKIFLGSTNIKKSPQPQRYQYELLECYTVLLGFIFLLNYYDIQYLKCSVPFRKNIRFLSSTTAINKHTYQNKSILK